MDFLDFTRATASSSQSVAGPYCAKYTLGPGLWPSWQLCQLWLAGSIG